MWRWGWITGLNSSNMHMVQVKDLYKAIFLYSVCLQIFFQISHSPQVWTLLERVGCEGMDGFMYDKHNTV